MKPSNILLLTCTGDRPAPLEMCARFIRRSTVQPTSWLIVDDGETSSMGVTLANPIRNFTHVRRLPVPNEAPHTLPLNLLAAVPHIPAGTEWIVFWEDDDWYAPEYLEWLLRTIKANPKAVLIGQSDARYYRVASREYQNMGNDKHASLCATAMHVSMIPRMVEVCKSTIDPFIDIHLWNWAVTQKHSVVLESHPHVVGIKELPGRRGRTYGWRGGVDFVKDPDGVMLREWVGAEDARQYLSFYSKGDEACK